MRFPLRSSPTQCWASPARRQNSRGRVSAWLFSLQKISQFYLLFLQKRRWGEELMCAQPMSCSDVPTAVLPTGLPGQECASPLVGVMGRGFHQQHQVLG